MLLANTDNKIEEELNCLEVFKENYVDGILFAATVLTGRHKKLLGECKVPVVILGQCLKGYSCVYQDDFRAARELAEILLTDRKKPCFIGVTERDEAVEKNRRRALRLRFRKRGSFVCLSSSREPISPWREAIGA